jgi:thiol-disulfide isomerase/thioredoxin
VSQVSLTAAAALSLFALTANPALGGIVEDVRASFASRSDAPAIQLLRAYRASKGVTPEYLEAVSWLARAEFESRNYTPAAALAQETYSLSLQQLKSRPLDREPHLAIALGAAIEVQAGVMAAQNRRDEAVTFLREQTKLFGATSIAPRIQKNLLLLTLEGKPAPPLQGVVLPKNRPVLLFFWAHWCPDCKQEAPVLKAIKAEFVPKGLAFIAPTQKYGYVAGGEEASPQAELAYIDQVRRKYYEGVIDSPAPVNEANFVRYGVSTTPTLVVIDRAGIVRLYHPGAISYQELRSAIQRAMQGAGS